nr:hypothetical protein [Tanacetum cinerariifolium]
MGNISYDVFDISYAVFVDSHRIPSSLLFLCGFVYRDPAGMAAQKPYSSTGAGLVRRDSNSKWYQSESIFGAAAGEPSGNLTFSSHPELTSPEVNDDIFDSEGGNVLSEKLLDLDSTEDLHPPLHVNPLKVESDAENVYDDPFDFKGEKIKESKLLIDELDIPCDFPPFEYDTFISQDFSRVDALPSNNNEDKDFDPPFYEPLFFKEVPRSKMILPFSSENEEKVFKPGIHTSEKVHLSFIPELSHQGYKIFKINQVFKSLMKILLFSCGKDIHTLAVPCLHFYPLHQLKYGGKGLGQAK